MKSNKTNQKPNLAKAKKQGTQEFFNKSKSQGLVFNKAPMNKTEAYAEQRTKIMADADQNERTMANPKGAAKNKSFLTKLYQDDDEFDELKVLGGIDEEDEEVNEARQEGADLANKRKEKAQLKKPKLGTHSSIKNDRVKIGKLALRKGAFAMFAVCEIGKDYLIVNHTRNCKGYVHLNGTKFKAEQFKVGQLVVAMVNAEIGGAQTGHIYNMQSGRAGLNRKLQLTLEENYINKGQNIDTITKGMVFTATVESKEAKGFILNLGFRDQTKGFMKFSPEANERLLKAGSISVLVKSVITASKIVKCELLTEQNCVECVQQQEQSVMTNIDEATTTPQHVRPGFLVSGKVSKSYENGVEITFLGGITGTCFADHFDEEMVLANYKIGTKVTTRVISVDPVSKVITTSMKKAIVGWSTKRVEHLSNLKVGQKFENVKVQSQLYGDSYLINLKKDGLKGFLHKTQTTEEEKEEVADPEKEDDEEEKKAKTISNKVYEVGYQFQSVKIKEINYFDGVPVLSSRDSVLASTALNYNQIKPGEFFNAKIEKVNLAKQFIRLSINQFVTGILHLEHMADNALKVMPPKFQETGKEIAVRVLNVDSSKRLLEFTKKDTLMKKDVPVFNNYKEVKKGDKVVGVIVAECEHGYVVKSFGSLKGLLTYEDVKAKLTDGYDTAQFKAGSIVKAYVMFKKRDQGLALTLSKKKAKTASEGDANADDQGLSTIQGKYLPSEEQVEALFADAKYEAMVKASKSAELLGQVNEFRILETDESLPYHIVKSTDASKKSKNFLAIVPKCLITNHPDSIGLTLNSELTYKGLVLDLLHSQIPVVSLQPELIALKDDMLDNNTKELTQGQSYVGVVNGVVGKAGQISVMFRNGIKKTIKVKDLNLTQDYRKVYHPGKVIRVGVNKLERLCTKQKVIEACLTAKGKAVNEDQIVKISSFCKQYIQNIQSSGLQVGSEVDAEVQLVKDYGIIAQIKGEESSLVKTGFIMNDQKKDKKYKQGQAIKCRVLDIDPVKNIADLSEKLIDVKDKKVSIEKGAKVKAIVELNKESYLIVSIKSNRSKIGFCMLTNFNSDQTSNPHVGLQIGEEIEVEVVTKNSMGFYELVPAVQADAKKSAKRERVELIEGTKFNGMIKSIKNQCMYVSVPSAQKGKMFSNIGRLHITECASQKQFSTCAVGDIIDVKILKVQEDEANGRTWIELTRNEKHMAKLQGLDKEQLESTPLSVESLKHGKKYDVVIMSCSMQHEQAINMKFSQPMLVQVSPFVRGSIPFNQIVEVEELAKYGSQMIMSKKFTVGKTISAIYIGKGQFSLISQETKEKQKKRGDLVTARYVKHTKGRGVTVQISEGVFGFIESCEITDEISGNVVKHLADKAIFSARVIDLDKNGKLQLSTRESVLDDKAWKEIRPEGTSIRFQEQDATHQLQGNQRNKILKYGAGIALQKGDLAIGYIVSIGKPGCFIQIGHNCVVRAGLNELSDQKNFDFQTQLPIGTIVLGRISRVHEATTGEKKFDFSTRQSLVVYGVGVTERSKLQVGDEVASIVMAQAEGKAFAQIKGTYIQIKVKGDETISQLKVGDHITSALKKVTNEKISSIFTVKTGHGSTKDMTDEERKAKVIFESVKEAAAKDIDAVRTLGQAVDAVKGADFDPSLIQASNFTSREEQIAQQIKDLEELRQKQDQEDGDGSGDEDMVQEDSDAEEMKRLINYDDNSEEAEEESDEDMDADSEEGEAEETDPEEDDSEAESDSEAEVTNTKTKLKKRSLKDRLGEEQEIREKEKRMRTGDDAPKDIDDFERLLVANTDQSYLWIQYMAFMLDNVDASAARKVAERAVKSVAMTNDQDKLNLWTAFMNLESNFGTQETLEACTKRALELNDRKKIYLNLVDIYKASKKYEYIEVIYKQLAKKYNNSLEIWSAYIEFLIEIRVKKEDPAHFLLKSVEFSDPKTVLQRSLQALTKDQHVNMISKFGMLEFKNGSPESGRTMFEGIVSNYPKRMDIWAIYMDMEIKHGQGNETQARHLFERCLSNDFIQKKPKKMKLVFQKYMEFESKLGNKTNLSSLRERVEAYLSTAFDQKKADSDEGSD